MHRHPVGKLRLERVHFRPIFVLKRKKDISAGILQISLHKFHPLQNELERRSLGIGFGKMRIGSLC